ncbi:MAG: hypothetical protein ABIH87_01890 [bacterium]
MPKLKQDKKTEVPSTREWIEETMYQFKVDGEKIVDDESQDDSSKIPDEKK